MPVDASVISLVGDAGPDGGFLVVFTDGSLWHLTPDRQWRRLPLSEVSAVSVDRQTGSWWAAYDVDSVARIDPATSGVAERLRPNVSVWRRVQRWIVDPLRFVIPQTGELGDVIASAISGQREVAMGDPSDDQTQVARYEWFRPLVSCGSFLSVVMLVNLWLFRRTDY